MKTAYIHQYGSKTSAATQKRLNAFIFDGHTVIKYEYLPQPDELTDAGFDTVIFDTAPNNLLFRYAQWGLIAMCETDSIWRVIDPVDEFKHIFKTESLDALVDKCADNPRGYIHPIAKILVQSGLFDTEAAAEDYLWDSIYG